MQKLCPIEMQVPAHWVSYLVNCDASGLEPSDMDAIKAFCQKHGLPEHAASSEEYGIGRFEGVQASLETVTWLVPYVPFLIRRKWFADSRSWELFAVFPTIPALSSEWYPMQGYAENGDSFAVTTEYMNASRKIRGHDPAKVAAFESQVRQQWERDPDFLCKLYRYERIQPRHHEERRASWKGSRA